FPRILFPDMPRGCAGITSAPPWHILVISKSEAFASVWVLGQRKSWRQMPPLLPTALARATGIAARVGSQRTRWRACRRVAILSRLALHTAHRGTTTANWPRAALARLALGDQTRIGGA